MKNRNNLPVGKLMPKAVPEKAWQQIMVDLITKLLWSQDYNSVLVVYD